MTSAPDRATADFLYLLDSLEEALSQGSRLLFSARTLVDEQECLEIVKQLRLCVPAELFEARVLLADRDGLLADAEVEAKRIVRHAETQARKLIEDSAITRGANARARKIEVDAERSARELQADAEKYGRELLQRVGARLEKATEAVRGALSELQSDDLPSVTAPADEPPRPADIRRARYRSTVAHREP